MSCFDLSVAIEITSPSAPERYSLHLTSGVLHICEAGLAGCLSSLQPTCGRAPNRAPLALCSSYVFAQDPGCFLFLRSTNLACCPITEEKTEGQRGKPAGHTTKPCGTGSRVSWLLLLTLPLQQAALFPQLPMLLPYYFLAPSFSKPSLVTVAGWKWACRAAQSVPLCLPPSTALFLAE